MAKDLQLMNIEDSAMSITNVIKQVELIQRLLGAVMKEGEHYGKVPGTEKPTLYKAGAEKLCLTFRLNPSYEIVREIRETEFIAYTMRCELTHIPSGLKIASGIGSCNSKETKYHYRNEYTPTNEPVPKEYWTAKKANNNKEMKRIIGDGKRPYKTEDGKWVIAFAEQVINENPWDLDNTIIKMACKRSLTAATLNATAASDIFSHDLEELMEQEEELLFGGKSNSKSDTDHEEEEPKTDFDTLLQTYQDVDQKSMESFLKLCAKEKGLSTNKLKALAVKHMDDFIASYRRFGQHSADKKRGRKAAAEPKTAPIDVKPEPHEPLDAVYANLHYYIEHEGAIFKQEATRLGFPPEFVIDQVPLEQAKMLHDGIMQAVMKRDAVKY